MNAPSNQQRRKICALTLDLENDCGGRVGASFDAVNPANISRLIDFIRAQNIPLTIFVTGKIFEEKPQALQLIQDRLENVEFALHSYAHLNPPARVQENSQEINNAVRAYRQFMGHNSYGYRSPLGHICANDFAALQQHGFLYDSSIFPTMRPGLFNHLSMPSTPFYMREFQLVEIPCSVFPGIPIPLGLGYMRLLGPGCARLLFRAAKWPSMPVVGFHLHDVFQTPHTGQLSAFWKFFYRRNVQHGFSILTCLLKTLKRQRYQFILMKDAASLCLSDG